MLGASVVESFTAQHMQKLLTGQLAILHIFYLFLTDPYDT